MADSQEDQFERLGIQFESLSGRRLQLIDCQNLFCEVDKYARRAHPDVRGFRGERGSSSNLHLIPNSFVYFTRQNGA